MRRGSAERRLDVGALLVAGLVNSVLAPLDYGLVVDAGTVGSGGAPGERADWIASHTARWQAGWSFWLVVTTTFAWSFYALGRNLRGLPQLVPLAIGLAVLAAAVDLVGIVAQIAVVPELAERAGSSGAATPAATATFAAAQEFAHALIAVAAFGIYSVAGLVLVPALFATPDYPRPLAWLGTVEWGVAAVASGLLAFDAPGADPVAATAFVLFAPWLWGSAWWIARRR